MVIIILIMQMKNLGTERFIDLLKVTQLLCSSNSNMDSPTPQPTHSIIPLVVLKL